MDLNMDRISVGLFRLIPLKYSDTMGEIALDENPFLMFSICSGLSFPLILFGRFGVVSFGL